MSILSFALQAATADPNGTAEKIAEAATTASAATGSASHLILLLTVFALAVFLGVEIITKIPPTLHTPLMSGSNAISGITLVGAILAAGGNNGTLASVLGFSAVVCATMNVVGGFVVTNRMLAMFKSRK
ncbi:NAD(P) transhydrogenase subunit alpha [Fuerstiella marisgermanici]|uniref:proton-translocating NAD(P)(+) transhydrogenase n=1 Tax=Fuerstiella marisgermanici TaxID=1891926 RepID=A0A1P8WIT2_9PLAN|nr:NAD(P) transhydrogenase subunit alpha [Fuerstiella marisgermanici]APZ93953.1 NAD(P) transhydrogenase subunit alpha [Fuerstiella marisgermanici]